MTGFGRAKVPLAPSGLAVVEIRTLNHRFLEMECRLPEGLRRFEDPIRRMVRGMIHRGRVSVSVNLRSEGGGPRATFQAAVARRYVAQLQRLRRQLHLPGSVTLEMILGLPQVVTLAEQDEETAQWWPSLRRGVAEALSQAVKMRQQEGARLGKALVHLGRRLGGLNARIQRRVPIVQRRLEKRWSTRIRSIARNTDRAAVAAEAASLVQARDISEELTRITSHLVALRQVVGNGVESPGRTTDFLAQELHREVNTLGTKAEDGQVIRWVVAMKGQIEKLREQAANLE
jgi:uncharacterized protein (TIGR00255 family)